MRLSNKKGFTLAEVLVTLGVIGVIASMTVPTLVQDINDAQLKTAWKKTFADFAQATKRVAQEKGGDLNGAFPGGDTTVGYKNMRDAYLPYLNYIKICDPTSIECWHAGNSWYYLSGGKLSADWNWKAHMILNNGAFVNFHLRSSTCNYNESANSDTCANINFDVNGFKGPNKIGRDIFGARVLKNGNVIPYGTQGDSNYTNYTTSGCNVSLYPTTSGWNCSADYLYQ